MSSADGLTPAAPARRARFSAAGFLHHWHAPRTLAGRLALRVFLASYGTVLLASALLYYVALETLYSAEDQVLQQRIETSLAWLDQGPYEEEMLYHEISENNVSPREIYIRIYDRDRKLFVETPEMGDHLPVALFPDPESLRLDRQEALTISNDKGETFRALTMRATGGGAVGATQLYIQAAANTSLDQAAIVWLRNAVAMIVLASAAFCWLLAIRISRRGLTPLTDIASATHDISGRTLAYRLPLEGMPEELQQLGGDFNAMLGRLELTYSSLRHYADDVAHELRGPLNKMLLESDVTLARSRTGDDYREALETNVEEARQLARIVDSILFLARAENATMEIERKRVDLCQVIDHVGEFFEASAEDAGVTLTVDCEAELMVMADRVLLQRAVSNLVSNALSHSRPGGRLILSARDTAGQAEILVEDSGEGIAADKLAHVFERFYRADGVRTSGTRLGLGLPITKGIVGLHGGTISISSIEGKGTTVRILLPRVA